MIGWLLSALDAGGATVETTLRDHHVRPGGVVSGRVLLTGGRTAVDVQAVTVALAARVEVESGDHEWSTGVSFAGGRVADGFTLGAGDRHVTDFSIDVPWETPITAHGGWQLRGMDIGVRTEVAVARSVDRSDIDPLVVHPLPAQERVLDACARLGFRFRHADVEMGTIPGSRMPFYQEIELLPGGAYAGRINQLEVTFIAGPTAMDVVLEADRRGGLLSEGRDALSRFRVDYATLDTVDWEGALHREIDRLAGRRRLL